MKCLAVAYTVTVYQCVCCPLTPPFVDYVYILPSSTGPGKEDWQLSEFACDPCGFEEGTGVSMVDGPVVDGPMVD